jgi:hypothetical protein
LNRIFFSIGCVALLLLSSCVSDSPAPSSPNTRPQERATLDFAWGDPVNGLRCGLIVNVAATNRPTFVLALHNTSQDVLSVHVGTRLNSQLRPASRITLFEENGDGELRSIEPNGRYLGVGGNLIPFVVTLLPGSIYTIEFEGQGCNPSWPRPVAPPIESGAYSATAQLEAKALSREDYSTGNWTGTCRSAPVTYSIKQNNANNEIQPTK